MRLTVDQYLAMEREAFERHIYLDGEIHAMVAIFASLFLQICHFGTWKQRKYIHHFSARH